MRLLLLILLLALGSANLKAQVVYSQGNTVKGKLASYYCVETVPNIIIKVRNVLNKDTLFIMYYDNGEKVPQGKMLDSQYDFKYSDYIQAFKDVLTSLELQQLKNMIGTFTTNVVADKKGNALEMEFVFSKKNSILTNLDTDRLFQLETKLKKLLKLKIKGEDCKIKNVKYSVVITFRQDLQ